MPCIIISVRSGQRVISRDIGHFQLREMDAIPLLLDCCNIDARNPRKFQTRSIYLLHVAIL